MGVIIYLITKYLFIKSWRGGDLEDIALISESIIKI
jgi:hypothetical protein